MQAQGIVQSLRLHPKRHGEKRGNKAVHREMWDKGRLTGYYRLLGSNTWVSSWSRVFLPIALVACLHGSAKEGDARPVEGC